MSLNNFTPLLLSFIILLFILHLNWLYKNVEKVLGITLLALLSLFFKKSSKPNSKVQVFKRQTWTQKPFLVHQMPCFVARSKDYHVLINSNPLNSVFSQQNEAIKLFVK